MARPRKHPPQGAAVRIEKLAAEHWDKRGIAVQLGTSLVTFNRWCTEQPELQEAFDRGRERERQALHSRLYRVALGKEKSSNPEVISAIFLLKARHGYREGEQGEQGNRVSLTFNLPGPLKPEQFVVDERKPEPERLPAARVARS